MSRKVTGRHGYDPDEALAAASRAAGALEVSFADPSLVVEAVSAPDWAGNRDVPSYQRLELLGDSVVGLVTVDHLLRNNPDLPEGDVSRLRSEVVSGPALAAAAERAGIADAVLTDQDLGRPGSRRRESVLSDVFEALIGALYLDQGIEVARDAVERLLLAEAVPLALSGARRDPKGVLQELRAEQGLAPPVYRVSGSEGPDHDPTFRVEVTFDDEVVGAGSGPSKKAAEQAAAADALGGQKWPSR